MLHQYLLAKFLLANLAFCLITFAAPLSLTENEETGLFENDALVKQIARTGRSALSPSEYKDFCASLDEGGICQLFATTYGVRFLCKTECIEGLFSMQGSPIHGLFPDQIPLDFILHIHLEDINDSSLKNLAPLLPRILEERARTEVLPLGILHDKISLWSHMLPEIQTSRAPLNLLFRPFLLRRLLKTHEGVNNSVEATRLGLRMTKELFDDYREFLLWNMAWNLERFSISLLNPNQDVTRALSQVSLDARAVCRAFFQQTEHIESPDDCREIIFNINMLATFKAFLNPTMSLEAQYADKNWLKDMLAVVFPAASELPEYEKLDTYGKIAYRTVMYTSMFNPSSNEDITQLQEKLYETFIEDFESAEISTGEMEFLYIVIKFNKLYDFAFNLLKRRPKSELAHYLYKSMVKNVVRIFPGQPLHRKLALLMHRKYPSARDSIMHCEDYWLELRREEAHLNASASSTLESFATHESVDESGNRKRRRKDNPISCTNAGLNGCVWEYFHEHFLSNYNNILPDPDSVTSEPGYQVTERIMFEPDRFQREFMLPALDEELLRDCIMHFRSHRFESDYGVPEWLIRHPEHEKFDHQVLKYTEGMFSVLGWLVRSPDHAAHIYYEGSQSLGEGLTAEAMSTFAEVLFLPSVQLFRYDAIENGFLPLPTVTPAIMGLLGEFHGILLEAGLPLPINLSSFYAKFLFYEEPLDESISSTIRRIYAKEFQEYQTKTAHSPIYDYYPQRVLTNIPFSLSYPLYTHPKPFPFLDPAKDLQAQTKLGWYGEPEKDDTTLDSLEDIAVPTPDSAEKIAKYEEYLVKVFKDHAMMGRFEYQRHFLRHIHPNLIHLAGYQLLTEIISSAENTQITADELIKACKFRISPNRIDSTPLTVELRIEDDEADQSEATASPASLSPAEALFRIFSEMSKEELQRFFWFCTGIKQTPLEGFNAIPITVNVSAPPSEYRLVNEPILTFSGSMPNSDAFYSQPLRRQITSYESFNEMGSLLGTDDHTDIETPITLMSNLTLNTMPSSTTTPSQIMSMGLPYCEGLPQIPLPRASTCYKTLDWTVYPKLSECRAALKFVLEHASGFEEKEFSDGDSNESDREDNDEFGIDNNAEFGIDNNVEFGIDNNAESGIDNNAESDIDEEASQG